MIQDAIKKIEDANYDTFYVIDDISKMKDELKDFEYDESLFLERNIKQLMNSKDFPTPCTLLGICTFFRERLK